MLLLLIPPDAILVDLLIQIVDIGLLYRLWRQCESISRILLSLDLQVLVLESLALL